ALVATPANPTFTPAHQGTISYCFVMGTNRTAASQLVGGAFGNEANDGPFPGNLRAIRFGRITDGLSNTLFAGPHPLSGGNPPGTGFFGFYATGPWAPPVSTLGQYALPVNMAAPYLPPASNTNSVNMGVNANCPNGTQFFGPGDPTSACSANH